MREGESLAFWNLIIAMPEGRSSEVVATMGSHNCLNGEGIALHP